MSQLTSPWGKFLDFALVETSKTGWGIQLSRDQVRSVDLLQNSSSVNLIHQIIYILASARVKVRLRDPHLHSWPSRSKARETGRTLKTLKESVDCAQMICYCWPWDRPLIPWLSHLIETSTWKSFTFCQKKKKKNSISCICGPTSISKTNCVAFVSDL